MLPRKLYKTQEEWMEANQGEIISELEKIGIRITPINKSNINDLTSYIICRDRKTLTIVCDATEYKMG